MQTLNQNIKGRIFKPVYLLFGEEAFLKKSYKSRLRKALTGEDAMNYNYFEGKGVNMSEITDLADTTFLFAEKRLVLMGDSGFFKGGAEAGELTKYMEGVPESTCLISVESEVDKGSRLYKAVEKYGCTAKLNHQEPVQLVRWTAGVLSKNGGKITGRIMEFFLNKAGDDMENTSSELEKLISYAPGREVITSEDVETICTTQTTNKIFDIITAITTWQTRRAMDLYGDLLTLRELSMCILFLIARQFNQTLRVKDLMGKRMDKSTITSRLKLQPFVTGKIMLRAKTLTREWILLYVNLCVDTEGGIKTGKLQDWLVVELLIANRYE